MPFLIAFVGWHNSGKTTVAVQVAALLHQQGYRVGVLKSTKESGLAPECAGSDTSRYSEAGAMRVALSAPDTLIVRENEDNAARRNPVTLAHCLFPDMDFVLIEGFKYARGLPKIEVRRKGIGEAALTAGESGKDIIALVCDTPVAEALPCFHSGDYLGIARFIIHLSEQQLADCACALKVNGQPQKLSPAVKRELKKLLQDQLKALGMQPQPDKPLVFELSCNILVPVRQEP